VRVEDAAGCTQAYSFVLADPPPIMLDLGQSPLLDVGGAHEIPLKISPLGSYLYSWQPPQSLSFADCATPTARPVRTTLYKVQVKNAEGCTTTDSLLVRVKKGEGYYAPNAFHPNGKAENHRFTVFGDQELAEKILLLQIYDRWGSLVFERRELGLNEPQSGWDGTARGQDMPSGVYIWYTEISMKDGSLIKKKGDVLLVR
jgi:gliding motility-associated-like protein